MELVTAFLGDTIVARGGREAVTRELERLYPGDLGAIRVFEDGSGQVVDLDYWDAAASAPPPRRRGRPSLGVAAREVTLLPRHWTWLSRQAGGASAAIRRLVEEASRQAPGPGEKRDSAYRFMSDMCGDRPGYEEALRALYRGEKARFQALTADWPKQIRGYLKELLA
ncbi:MAG: uncharacterized protein QOJ91_2965 [Sphingomonadales bacterium]|jgi:hypothetical protein|nr:uncharacterized protein [Sphingomonadales bacterium]